MLITEDATPKIYSCQSLPEVPFLSKTQDDKLVLRYEDQNQASPPYGPSGSSFFFFDEFPLVALGGTHWMSTKCTIYKT